MQSHARTRLTTLLMALAGTALFTTALLAGETRHEKKVFMLKAGDGEVVEADVSDLGLGESRSFVTESGRMVDLLQTPEGLEVYLDGELIDLSGSDEALHEHLMHARALAEERCDGDCEDGFAYAFTTEDGEEANVHVIRKHVEVICSDEEQCDDNVWISADGDVDLDLVHGDGDHQVIVVRKEIESSID